MNGKDERLGGGLGLEPDQVVLMPHDPVWRDAYVHEQALLKWALSDVAEEIHHIGSTAIPGIPAKPIIDILLCVHAFHLITDDHCCRLQHLGYQGSDRLHRAVLGRWEFMKGCPRTTHHLIVVQKTSPNWDVYLVFRDALLRSPDAARRYAHLKLALAQRFPDDRPSYAASKSEFITGIAERRGQSDDSGDG